MNRFQVLLYYKYVDVKDPEVVRDEIREFCIANNLKGRIIVAKEGINGTVEGTIDETEKYIAAMEKTKYFKGISYKKSVGTGASFPKLSVKARAEIVTTGIAGLNPQKVTGKYLDAEDLHKWYEEGREFYIVDMRNDFEYESGYFENFLPLGMKHFFELSNVLPKLRYLKNKTIVTVCTGGIRCEKASGYLVENGFADVYQLKDGIQTYMEKYPNEHFKGKLYVFDRRLTVAFNSNESNHEVVGRCMHCGAPADTYVNCELNTCHLHYISCSECKDSETGYAFCKQECKETYLQRVVVSL